MAFEAELRITGIISAEIKPISVKIATVRDQMEERGNLNVLKQALSLSRFVPFSSENKSVLCALWNAHDSTLPFNRDPKSTVNHDISIYLR